MGPWLVLVSPCFRENVVATCKIGSFLCSLDNLLQKNVIVLFFGNQISRWRSFEKRAIFDLLFTFFSHQGKLTKIPSAHISHTYIHTHILLTLLTFFALPILKKYEFFRYGFSLVWVLVLILIRAILEQSINNKMVSKILVGMSTTDMYLHLCQIHSHLYTADFEWRKWRFSKIQKSQKAPLLSSSHFAFYR